MTLINVVTGFILGACVAGSAYMIGFMMAQQGMKEELEKEKTKNERNYRRLNNLIECVETAQKRRIGKDNEVYYELKGAIGHLKGLREIWIK